MRVNSKSRRLRGAAASKATVLVAVATLSLVAACSGKVPGHCCVTAGFVLIVGVLCCVLNALPSVGADYCLSGGCVVQG